MISLDVQCLEASAIVAQSTIDDAHWQAFGYPKRPRRGRLFDAFISSDKLELENVLFREFFAVSFAKTFI
jgi:hypothetical protein